MAQDPSMTADPEQDAGGDDAQEQSGGFCIEIHVSASGSITVDVEPEAEEAGEEQGAGGEYGAGSAPEGTPAKNIKDALTIALEIFRAGGQMPGAADDSFHAGFAGATS